MDVKIIEHALYFDDAMRVDGSKSAPTAVNAAYNRQMGEDRRGMTVFGYFNVAGVLFAWSYFEAYTTNIGVVADGWPIYHRWDEFAEPRPNGHVREHVLMLSRKMVDGDL